MSTLHYVPLPARGVVALSGEPARPFLQGLISNDLDRLTPERALYAALLTPQGKFLFDFVITERDGQILLETEGERVAALIQRLTLYRLRTKVVIEDASARFACAALIGQRVAAALGLPDEPGACRREGGGVVMIDPRLAALGGRALLPRDDLQASLEALGFAPADPQAYERHRLALGVPDGSRDLPLERATLLESGFEELRGVDFKKGCFVGQELTARMKYRGLVRKRLMPVTFAGPPPDPGTIIRADGKDVGEMRSGTEGVGLALLRLDRLETASTAGTPLLAGETEVAPARPTWASF
jgi:tRNA-modifying protein YgfZ